VTVRYPWLLFDADDTLFDYSRAEAEALRGAFEAHGVAFDDGWLPAYQVVNARRARPGGVQSPSSANSSSKRCTRSRAGVTLPSSSARQG
jgi:FMN phosphatase YigB (HAD superfamily)